MQDRFKFRVWDKELEEMHEERLDKIAEPDELWYDKETDVWEVYNDAIDEQERFVVMQCTGLKDKNGNLIYEGDIIKTNYGDIGIIKYSTHFSRWQIIFKQGRKHLLEYKEIGVHIFDFTYPKMHLEVIGNIYENPDMIEKK